jgi:hypothetical protein
MVWGFESPLPHPSGAAAMRTWLYDNGRFDRDLGDAPLLDEGSLVQLADGTVHKVVHRRMVQTGDGWAQIVDFGPSTQRPVPLPGRG